MLVLGWLIICILSLKMTKEKNQNNLKKIIDNLLLINLFTVIFFAIFFVFAIIMQFNRLFIFIDFIQRVWSPLIVPLITILIIGTDTTLNRYSVDPSPDHFIINQRYAKNKTKT